MLMGYKLKSLRGILFIHSSALFIVLSDTCGLIFQLRQLIAQINFIEQQVKQLEKKISALLKALNSPITTIPDVSEINGATILSEIGDIHRFEKFSPN